MTAVIACSCRHEFQDKQYTKGHRVHNYARKANGGVGGFRCTVCQNVKQTGRRVIVKEKEIKDE